MIQSRLLRKVIAETHSSNLQDEMAHQPPCLPQRVPCFHRSESTLLLRHRVCFVYFFSSFSCAALNSWEGLSLSLLFFFTIAATGAKSIIRASKCHPPTPFSAPPAPSLHTLPPQPLSASRGASDLQSIIHDPTSSNHYCEEWDPVVPNSPPAGKRLRAIKTGL